MIGNNDLLDVVTQGILDGGAQLGKLGCFSLTHLLLVFRLLELQTFFRNAHEFLTVKFFKLADGVFIDGVNKEENFETLLLEHLDEGRVLGSGKRFTSKIIYHFWVFSHTHGIVYIAGKH